MLRSLVIRADQRNVMDGFEHWLLGMLNLSMTLHVRPHSQRRTRLDSRSRKLSMFHGFSLRSPSRPAVALLTLPFPLTLPGCPPIGAQSALLPTPAALGVPWHR